MPGKAPTPDYVLREHGAGVQAVTFHSSLQILYSGDAEGFLIVWGLQDRRPILVRRPHSPQAGIICLLLLAEASVLLSQGRDGDIFLWGLDSEGLPQRAATRHLSGGHTFCKAAAIALPCIFFNMDAAASDGEASLHGSQTRLCQGANAHSTIVAFPAVDATCVALASIEVEDKEVILCQSENTMMCGMCMTINLHLNSDHAEGLLVLVGYEDGTVAVWQACCPAAPITLCRLQQEPIMALAIDADGSGGVCGSAGNMLVDFAIDLPGKQLQVRHCTEMLAAGTGDIAIRKDARVVAVAAWNGSIAMYHRHKWRLLALLQYHKGGATAVTFQAATQRLASGSRDGTIATWLMFAQE